MNILQDAKMNVQQNAATFQGSGVSRPDLIRNAADGDIEQRLADINADAEPDVTEILINTVVRNRIRGAEGI